MFIQGMPEAGWQFCRFCLSELFRPSARCLLWLISTEAVHQTTPFYLHPSSARLPCDSANPSRNGAAAREAFGSLACGSFLREVLPEIREGAYGRRCFLFLFHVVCQPLSGDCCDSWYYQIRRSVWRRKRRKSKRDLGFCPSSAALGAALLFLSVYYRPSVDFAIEASLQEKVEEDDQGDPETPEKYFNRQLRQIRRGERVEGLVLRL